MSINEATLQQLSGQRCLVIEPYFQTPAVETGLEIAKILARQNTVFYLGPDRLACVTDESYLFTGRVLNRLSRKRRVSRYLSAAAFQVPPEKLRTLIQDLPRDRFHTFLRDVGENLSTAIYENFDLGQSLRSSMISLTRNTDWVADPEDPFTRRLALDALVLYELTLRLIERLRIDLVVLFNGRLASVRGIRRASEAKGIRWWVHERGARLDKFAIYECSTPHQPSSYRAWVDDWWGWSADGEQRAATFLQNRRAGVQTNWFVFTRKQQAGALPPRDSRRRVVFFTSSEDEMAAIGDEFAPDSPLCVQAVALRELGQACRDAGHELVVRFHPNTPQGEQHLTAAAHQAADIVCTPQSQVDTYALMDSADVVLTHNSTAGLEAAASGKPAFYTGRNIFEGCASMRRVKSRLDLRAAMDSQHGFDRTDALKYLNFLAVHGIPYRTYRPRGFISGSFDGRDLNFPLSTLRDLRVRWKRGGR